MKTMNNPLSISLRSLFLCLFLCLCLQSCDTDEDPVFIVACDYLIPLQDGAYVFANADTSFTMNIGPYNGEDLPDAPADLKLISYEGTEYRAVYACPDSMAYIASYEEVGPSLIDAFDFPEFGESTAASTFDPVEATQLFESEMDAFVYPRALLFATLLRDTEIGSDEYLNTSFSTGLVNGDEPQALWPYCDVGWRTDIVEYSESRTVAGTQYDDVIKMEFSWSLRSRDNGSESYDVDRVFNYWFAKGIGLIETDDGNYKLQP